jgi:hypothetical protein
MYASGRMLRQAAAAGSALDLRQELVEAPLLTPQGDQLSGEVRARVGGAGVLRQSD